MARSPLTACLLVVCGALVAAPRAPAATAAAATAAGTATVAREALATKQVLRRALRSDPAQEYFLYIPSAGGEGAPLFVAVHGISRNAEEHATLFSRYAEAYRVVLVAPYFTEARHGDYQRLGRAGRGPRADVALDSLIAEVAASTGAVANKFYLFGYSGGAQFTHRYAMAHPERVAGAVVGAAGWYTFPDARTAYPYGIGRSDEMPDVRFEPEKFLRVPIAVFVGDDDVTNQSLRRNKQVDKQQGTTRLERARNWVAAMRAAATERGLDPLVTYQDVEGIHHSFRQFMLEGELGERVFGALFGPTSGSKAPATPVAPQAEERRGSRSAAPRTWVEAEPLLACASGWR